MGRSDPHIFNFYNQNIKPIGTTALLGFTNNRWFDGDLYDLQLGNWNINSEWELPKKYDTIICLRCAYFCKNPEDFIVRCYNSLNDGGKLYVDWGLGDHWRFKDYKIGWLKNGEHEYAYESNNYLWSAVWDASFLNDRQYCLFQERVKKFNYDNVESAIQDEVPVVYDLKNIKKYFNISYKMIALWDDSPQLYVLLSGNK
jgi:SAM-dependent methyltransferase